MDFKLDDAIGYTMEKTLKILAEELHRAFRQVGHEITPYQFHILFMLWEEEGLFMSQLKKGAIVDSPTVTRNVDYLERSGYVERRADGDDRRKTRLFLTEKGRASRDVLLPAQLRHYERSRVGISDEEMKVLKDIAAKVKSNLGR